MKVEGEVAIRLRGDNLDPEEVNAYLSIKCTESYTKGRDATFSAWVLSIKTEDEYIDVHELVTDLVEELKPAQAKIIEIVDKYGLSVDFWIELDIDPRDDHQVLYNEEPLTSFRLEPNILKFLCSIGATVYVDYGYYSLK